MSEKNINLIKKLMRVQMLLHRVQGLGFRAFGPAANPLRGQGRILAILKMRPEITQKELSYLLDMRQQSLSELLSKLESRGFITRAVAPDDRRVTMIRLTEEGKDAAPDGDDFEADGAFDCLDEQERKQLEQLLEKLAVELERQLESAGESPFRPGWGMFGPGEAPGWGPGLHHRHGHGGTGGRGRFGRDGFPWPGKPDTDDTDNR